MRRLLLLVLAGVLALSATPATHTATNTAANTPNAVSLALVDGRGFAAVKRRGSLLMRVGYGRIWITDLPGGTTPNVSCDRSGRRVSSSTVVYRGRGVSCRVFGGPWRARMRGRNIDASGVMRGYLTLDREGSKGLFSIDGGPYRPWPAERKTYRLLSE